MCPICACPSAADFFLKPPRKLLICRLCRHIWWDRFPPEDELGAYYRNQYTGTHAQASIQNEARAYYAGHLRELLAHSGTRATRTSIADYGCSIPVLLDEARRSGFRYCVGIDYGDEALAAGSSWGVEMVPPSQLERIPDGILDMVRFSHILEHSPSPASVLDAMLRKVRPGGVVYITQPNFPVFRPELSPCDLKDTVYPEHLHFFSPISLLELARRAGITVRRFFTHQNEAEVLRHFEENLDLDYARERLAPYRALGDPFFPELGNYPAYTGENSSFYGIKPVC